MDHEVDLSISDVPEHYGLLNFGYCLEKHLGKHKIITGMTWNQQKASPIPLMKTTVRVKVTQECLKRLQEEPMLHLDLDDQVLVAQIVIQSHGAYSDATIDEEESLNQNTTAETAKKRKIYLSWFQILQTDEKVFKGNYKRSVLLQNCGPLTENEIEQSLQTKGNIEKVFTAADGIVVIFEKEEDASRLRGNEEIFIGKRRVRVRKKCIPSEIRDQFILKGQFEDAENLRQYIQSCGERSPYKIKRLGDSVFFLEYRHVRDVGEIRRKLEEGSNDSKMYSVCESDYVRLENVESLSDEAIMKQFSETFDVTQLQRRDDGDEAFLYFADSVDTFAVPSAFSDDSIVIGGVTVNISYWPFPTTVAELTNISQDNPETSKLPQQHSGDLFSSESGLREYRCIHHMLEQDFLLYIATASTAKTNFNDYFKDLANVRFSSDDSGMFLVIFHPSNSLAQHSFDQAHFEQMCVKKLETYCDQLSVKWLTFSVENIKSFQQSYGKYQLLPWKVKGQAQQLFVRWNIEKAPGTIKVVGYTEVVKDFALVLSEHAKALTSIAHETPASSSMHAADAEGSQSSIAKEKLLQTFVYTPKGTERDFTELIKGSRTLMMSFKELFKEIATVDIQTTDSAEPHIDVFVFKSLPQGQLNQSGFQTSCSNLLLKYFTDFTTETRACTEEFVRQLQQKRPTFHGIIEETVADTKRYLLIRWHADNIGNKIIITGLREDVKNCLSWFEKEYSGYIQNRKEKVLTAKAGKSTAATEEAETPLSFNDLLQIYPNFFQGPEDRCVLVQKVPNHWSKDDLRNCCQSHRISGGGKVAGIFCMVDGHLVVFKDSQSAKTVLKYPEPTYLGRTLKVLPKWRPPIDDRRCMISGEQLTGKTQLEQLLSRCSAITKRMFDIEQNAKCSYVVTFDKPTDVDKLRKDATEMDEKVKVEKVCRADCVKVEKVKHCKKEVIEGTFQEKKFDVTLVEKMPDADIAFVYFSKYKDAAKAEKDVLFVNYTIVRVSMYVPPFTERKEETPETVVTSEPQSTRQAGLNQFSEEIEASKELELVCSSDSLKADLSDEFIGLARVQTEILIERRNTKICFQYTPVLKQNDSLVSHQAAFERACKSRRKKFIEKIISKQVPFSPEIAQKIVDVFGKKDEKTLIISDKAQVLIKWGEKPGSAKVVGLPRHIDEIKREYAVSNDTVQCGEIRNKYLSDFGILDKVKKLYHVTISSASQVIIRLEGTKTDVDQAKKMLTDELQNMHKSDLSFLDTYQRQFLHDRLQQSSSNADIPFQEKLREYDIKGLTMEYGKPVLVCPKKDLEKYQQILQENLRAKIFSYVEDYAETLKDPDWQRADNFIRKLNGVTLSKRSANVLLVGFSKHFVEAEMELTKYFNGMNEKSETVTMGTLEKEYISNHISDIPELGKLFADLDWHTEENGISISGNKQDIKQARSMIMDFLSTLRTNQVCFRDSWKVKYWSGSAGKQYIKTVERDWKCEIMPQEDDSAEKANTQSSAISKRYVADNYQSTSAGNSHISQHVGIGQTLTEKMKSAANFVFGNSPAKVSSSASNSSTYPSSKIPGTDVTIRLIKGDITHHQADAIVNTSNDLLELREAGVSGSILRNGGDEIQREMTELRRKNGGYLKTGQAVTTGKGWLRNCRKIIHVAGPVSYQTSGTEFRRLLRESVFSCLRQAQAYALTSVAIPAISCGVFGGDPKVCASVMVQSIAEYFRTQHPDASSIKVVDVIEYMNRDVIREFEKEIGKLGTSDGRQIAEGAHRVVGTQSQFRDLAAVPTSTVPSHNNEEKGCKLIVQPDNIVRSSEDVILNTVGKEYNLSLSRVSQSIVKEGGNHIQHELLHQPMHQSNVYRVTKAGALPCKRIVHMVVPNSPSRLSDYLLEVFSLVDQMRFQSLAIPAVGTGNASMKIDECAYAVKSAYERFRNMYPSFLRTIKVAVFDQNILPTFQRILSFEKPVTSSHSDNTSSLQFPTSLMSEKKDDLASTNPERYHPKYPPIIMKICANQQNNVEQARKALERQTEKKLFKNLVADVSAKEVPESSIDKLELKYPIKVERTDGDTIVVCGLHEDVTLAVKALKEKYSLGVPNTEDNSTFV